MNEPPRNMPRFPPKPHLYARLGAWWCLDGNWLGWGFTPLDAFTSWQQRRTATSCIHQVTTPLQRRKAKQLAKLTADMRNGSR